MQIVTGDQAPTLERAEAVRLLEEMAAVVRTLFAVDAVPTPTTPTNSAVTAGAGGVPSSGGAAPAPTVAAPAAPLAVPPVATPPAAAEVPPPAVPAAGLPSAIPVPAMALLEEIAFLDD